MKKFIKVFCGISFGVILLITISACGNTALKNNVSDVTNVTNNQTTIQEKENETPPSPPPTESRNIKVVYTSLSSKESDVAHKTLKQIYQFESELTCAVIESTGNICTLSSYSNDNDIKTSLIRGDADAALGFSSDPNSDDLLSEFQFSYSYLYAIIKFSNLDWNHHMSYLVKKDNNEILNILNEGLNNVKSNGKYEEIYIKYFGEDDSMSILTN